MKTKSFEYIFFFFFLSWIELDISALGAVDSALSLDIMKHLLQRCFFPETKALLRLANMHP